MCQFDLVEGIAPGQPPKKHNAAIILPLCSFCPKIYWSAGNSKQMTSLAYSPLLRQFFSTKDVVFNLRQLCSLCIASKFIIKRRYFLTQLQMRFWGLGSQTYPLINQNLFLLLRICDQVHFISENVKKTHSAPVSPTSANISSVVFHWKIQFSHSRTYEAVRVVISKDWHAQLKFWSQEPQQTYQEANIVKIPHQNYGSLVPGTFLLRREQVSSSVPQIQC